MNNLEQPQHTATVEDINEPKAPINDLELQILFKWFAGECLGLPVETIIINDNHFRTLGHDKLAYLKEFMRDHGAMEHINIVGTNEVMENEIFTDGPQVS